MAGVLLLASSEWAKRKEKFYLQRVTHKSGPRWYIVFKGNAGLRQYLSATRYGVEHAKVIAISAGAGSVAGMRHASWGAAKGAVQGGGLLALIFTITLSTAEWLGDYEQRDAQTGKPKRDFLDLCSRIGIDVAKAVASAMIGSVLVALVSMGAMALGLAALPAAAIVVGSIAASVLVGIGLDWLDKKTGASEKLSGAVRDAVGHLGKKLPNDYSSYDRSIEVALQFGA